MGTVGEAVESGVGEDGVGEEADPFGNVTVAGDDEAGVAVTLDDEGVEVFRLLLVEPVETEVVHDQQVWREIATESGLEAVVGTGLAEFAEEMVGPPEKDGVAGAGGGGAECLGEEGLADPDRTDEEDMLLLLEEVQGEELVEVTAVELDGRRPVKVLQADAVFEAGLEEPPFELPGIAALDLVGKDEGEEGSVVELLSAGESEAVRQGGDCLAELESLEEGDEVCFETHRVAS
jgi:hypothetical protein